MPHESWKRQWWDNAWEREDKHNGWITWGNGHSWCCWAVSSTLTEGHMHTERSFIESPSFVQYLKALTFCWKWWACYLVDVRLLNYHVSTQCSEFYVSDEVYKVEIWRTLVLCCVVDLDSLTLDALDSRSELDSQPESVVYDTLGPPTVPAPATAAWMSQYAAAGKPYTPSYMSPGIVPLTGHIPAATCNFVSDTLSLDSLLIANGAATVQSSSGMSIATLACTSVHIFTSK